LTTAAIVAALAGAACGGSEPSGDDDFVSDITSVQITDVRIGTGTEATAGRAVTVHYTLWLYNRNAADRRGTRLQSSRDSNNPFPFTLGTGSVIAGWDQGVAGMRVGGQRILTIPPALAYGSRGQGQIPPNATLIFDIELLDVR
jgi:FKBP-type peptidyl-prolyl cis-trans isomerase